MKTRNIILTFLVCFGILSLSLTSIMGVSRAEENDQRKIDAASSPLFKIRTEKAINERNPKLALIINHIKEKIGEERLFFPLLSILRNHPVISSPGFTMYTECCLTVANPKCRPTHNIRCGTFSDTEYSPKIITHDLICQPTRNIFCN